jgi:Ran GTPase-activating protein (RanGAP) involved in mRNA processing and transport
MGFMLTSTEGKNMKTESKQEILKRREEIEQELVEILKKTESDFGLEDVKVVIYNEKENDDFHRLIAMFDSGGDASELDNVLELVSDAWNYFPHRVLDGISPAEKLLEYDENQKRK